MMFAAFALAYSASDRIVVEPSVTVPAGWEVQGASRELVPNLKFELLFAVKQSNLQELHDKLMEVSTPTSPTYGQHLSNDAVHALVAPAADDLAAVRAHLDASGIKAVESASPNSDMIRVAVTIAEAEALLGGVRYMQLHHAKS